MVSPVIEIVCIFAEGGIGVWLPVRGIAPGEDTPGDGIGVILFGMLGMVIGFFVGLLSIFGFWTTLRNRAVEKSELVIHPQEGVWPLPKVGLLGSEEALWHRVVVA